MSALGLPDKAMGKETGLVLFCNNVKHDGCGNVVDVGCGFIMTAKDFVQL